MKQARELGEGDKFRIEERGPVWTVIANQGNYITCQRNHGFLGLAREVKSIHYFTWVYPA